MSSSKSMSRRRRILDATARVIRRSGQGATVEEIAAEADYSAAALYRHFAGKDAIIQALVEEIRARLLEIFAEAPPLELPFESHLKWVLYRMAQFAEQERDVYIVAVNWGMQRMVSDGEGWMRDRAAFGDPFVEIMRRGIDEGKLKPANPELYAMALGGMLGGLNQVWIAKGPFDLKPHIDELVELFMHGASVG